MNAKAMNTNLATATTTPGPALFHRLAPLVRIGTEASYWEDDLKLAKEDAGFLSIYCPTAHEAKRVQRLLESENPKNMRRYARAIIERLS